MARSVVRALAGVNVQPENAGMRDSLTLCLTPEHQLDGENTDPDTRIR
jgi:hypothetical protein